MLELSLEINIALLALMCVGLLLALFFNLLSIFTILRNKRFCTVTNFYQVSNCVFISAIICTSGWMFPLHVISSSRVTNSMRLFMNKVILSMNASVTGHDVMNAIDRYNALSRPLKMRAIAGKKRCIIAIGFIWMLSTAVCVPSAIKLFEATENENLPRSESLFSNISTFVTISRSSTWNESRMEYQMIAQRDVPRYFQWLTVFGFILFFISPFTINLTLFILTVKRLRHSVKDIYKNQNKGSKTDSKLEMQRRTLRRYSRRTCRDRQKTLRFSAPPACTGSSQTSIPTRITNDKQKYRKRAMSEPDGGNTLRHKLYSMVFPSISFVSTVPIQRSERRVSAPANLSMDVIPSRPRPVLEAKISVDSGLSTISGTSTTSDDEVVKAQTIKHPRNKQEVVPSWLWRNRIKAVQNLAFALAMFCIEWLPYHIFLLLHQCCTKMDSQISEESDWESLTQYINGFFIALVALTNPVLHCVCSASFRESFVANIKWLLSLGRIKPVDNIRSRRHNSALPYSTSRFTSIHSQTFITKNNIYDITKTTI